MKVYICRHGETEANRDMVLMGCDMDAELTEKGRLQAMGLGKKLEGVKFDKVFLSPNQRAIDTWELTGWDLEYEIDERLREQSFGNMTGVKLKDIPEEIDKNYWKDRYGFAHEEGESLKSLVEGRVKEFLEDLWKLECEKVLILCHAGVMKAFEILMGSGVEDVLDSKIGNGECVVYEMS